MMSEISESVSTSPSSETGLAKEELLAQIVFLRSSGPLCPPFTLITIVLQAGLRQVRAKCMILHWSGNDNHWFNEEDSRTLRWKQSSLVTSKC